jgi:hypothetical protein
MTDTRVISREDGPRLAALIDRRRLSLDPPRGVKELGISSNSLAGWRAGTIKPRRDALVRVARALGWTYEYLIDLLDDPNLPLEPARVTDGDAELIGSIHFYRDGRVVVASDLPPDEQLRLAAFARAAVEAVNRRGR